MQYTPNPQHRNSSFSNVKSQWLVSISVETDCYYYSVYNGWSNNKCYWGVYHDKDLGEMIFLGVAPPPVSSNVKIAKFVGDSHDNWHGYPVAHWHSPYDRPGPEILKKWVFKGLISKPAMARIMRGKKCAL